MPDSTNTARLARLSRARLPLVAALFVGLLVGACGGSSPGAPVAAAGTASAAASTVATTSARTTAKASTPRSTTEAASGGAASGPPGALAYSSCMRANGVPSFPDPQPGGGLAFRASPAVISSPSFKAAQQKCGSLLPGPLSSASTSFSPQVEARALAQLRTVTECMRRHGVPDFPDPRATRPANLSLGQYREITNYEGVWLLFAATIDVQSPAWEHAASSCGALAESFGHPHH